MVSSRCTRVVVEPADGSSSYLFRAPAIASTPISKTNGRSVEIRARFLGAFGPGEIIGYVETASGLGAKTFNQEEHL